MKIELRLEVTEYPPKQLCTCIYEDGEFAGTKSIIHSGESLEQFEERAKKEFAEYIQELQKPLPEPKTLAEVEL